MGEFVKKVGVHKWWVDVRNQLNKFFQQSASAGILLLICAIIAMFLANSGFHDMYENTLKCPIGFRIGDFVFEMTVLDWMNDALMAIFFFVVGMEIKMEFLFGELRKPSAMLLPVTGALGGMLVPAFIYMLFNHGGPFTRGAGIPVATDIAFSLGILAFAAGAAPRAIVVFLTALAVADDLGGIIVIAVFYNTGLEIKMLLLALLVSAILYYLCRKHVDCLPIYILGGVILWYILHEAGIHPTIAGVILGFCIPASTTAFELQMGLLHRLYNSILPWSNFGIMPLFALANAGIAIGMESFLHLVSPIGFGIIAGLFIGKPLGIFGVVLALVKFKLVELPSNCKLRHFLAVSIVAGIGFTVSLFIASLAFDTDPEALMVAKTGIVCGSLLAGIFGVLAFTLVSHLDKKEHFDTTLASEKI